MEFKRGWGQKEPLLPYFNITSVEGSHDFMGCNVSGLWRNGKEAVS